MHYLKPPLTYDEQVELLLARGLAISNRERAKRWLARTSYYRLSAYFLPFKVRDTATNTYTDAYELGANFDAVIDLYKFDARLRVLMLQAIERIEVAVRASIAYEMSHALGVFSYRDPSNFSPWFDHARLMDEVQKEELRSREEFVAHFRGTYHLEASLPIWMMTEIISLGSLSTMYKGLRRNLQKAIAAPFNVPEGSFKSWLHTP